MLPFGRWGGEEGDLIIRGMHKVIRDKNLLRTHKTVGVGHRLVID